MSRDLTFFDLGQFESMSDAALLEAERRFLRPAGQEAPIDFDCPARGVFLRDALIVTESAARGTTRRVTYSGDTEVMNLAEAWKLNCKGVVQGHNCPHQRAYIMDNISTNMRRMYGYDVHSASGA